MSNNWFITIVNGFGRAGDKSFNNFFDTPSCPEEFFVCRDERTFAAWFSPMNVKWNDAKMLLLRYLRYISFMVCVTFFGPTFLSHVYEEVIELIDNFYRVIYHYCCQVLVCSTTFLLLVLFSSTSHWKYLVYSTELDICHLFWWYNLISRTNGYMSQNFGRHCSRKWGVAYCYQILWKWKILFKVS